MSAADVIHQHVEHVWEHDVLPSLMEYITIPCVSVHFDPQWREHGHLDHAVEHVRSWCAARTIAGLRVDVLELEGRTPLILIEVPAFLPEQHTAPADDTVLLYGHCDKQPEMVGWREDLGPWKPVLEGHKLFGRGGADDGYAAYAALLAIESAQLAGVPHYVREHGVTSFKIFMNNRGGEGSRLGLPDIDDGYLYRLCEAAAQHGGVVCPHPETIEIAWVLRDRLKKSDPEGKGGLVTWNRSRPDFVEADAVQRAADVAQVTRTAATGGKPTEEAEESGIGLLTSLLFNIVDAQPFIVS